MQTIISVKQTIQIGILFARSTFIPNEKQQVVKIKYFANIEWLNKYDFLNQWFYNILKVLVHQTLCGVNALFLTGITKLL